MTKQTTIVVNGALRVKGFHTSLRVCAASNIAYKFVSEDIRTRNKVKSKVFYSLKVKHELRGNGIYKVAVKTVTEIS